jgi:hypothetical protein
MTDIELKAESLIQEVQAAAYTSLANRQAVAARCRDYADANKSALPSWRLDELNGAGDFLQVGTQAGTAANPNMDAVDSDGVPRPTTTAARVKSDDVTSEIFSQKTADDVQANAQSLLDKAQKAIPDLLAPIIKGAAKGLWVYIAGAAVLVTGIAIAKKKGWI